MDDSQANQVGLHVPRMYRVAYRLLADADKAHDAVQDACVKALAGMGVTAVKRDPPLPPDLWWEKPQHT